MLLTNIFLVVLWMAVSGTVSSTWSSSINSIFTSRSVQSSQMGSTLVESIANGAQMALEHCQDKFKWNRWNCPESSFSRRGQQPITRESSYISAITSAGIVFSVIRNCSGGEIEGCGCSPRNSTENPEVSQTRESGSKTHWTWNGCSDHLEYGERIAKVVLDNLEKGVDTQSYARLHNNAAGRMAIRSTMQKRCRCHGVSGSCSLQTCWMQTAPFKDIADLLRKKYDRAVRVDYETGINRLSVGNSVSPVSEKIINIPKSELIYLLDSPNYCKSGVIQGWNGTKGRACTRTKGSNTSITERRSCKNLCRYCGHRVRKERRVVTKRCNCQFKWCCEVKCETCQETLDEFYCE